MTTIRELVGQVVPRKYVGGLLPTPGQLAELARPPHMQRGAVHVFCAGCSSQDVISKGGAKDLCRKAQTEAPTDWAGYYIQIDRCDLCTPGQLFVNPTLRKVEPK